MWVTAGTTVISGAVPMDRLAFSGGTVDGGGTLTVTEAMTWTGGTMGGGGSTEIPFGATLSIDRRRWLERMPEHGDLDDPTRVALRRAGNRLRDK